MVTRRHFLSGTGAGAGLFLSGYPVHGFTKEPVDGRIVVLLLEGGMDGLLAVPPIGDRDLFKQRKALVSSKALKLNPLFALHPNFNAFSRMLANEEASIVHATSFPYTARSHFEGQNVMQTGLKVPFSSKMGWLGRAMAIAKVTGKALSLDTPLILRGATDYNNFYPTHLTDVSLKFDWSETLDLIQGTHNGSVSKTFDKLTQKKSPMTGRWETPRDALALASEAARSLRKIDGPRVAVLTVPDFDDHAEILSGQPKKFTKIDAIFASLKNNLRDQWANTIVLTVTEFGRTVKVNGSEGTDHGYGSVGLLAGGLIKRSSVIADWPGLSKSELYEKRDLYATIDYRSVCAACIEAAFGLDHDLIVEEVFQDKNIPRAYTHIFGGLG